MNLLNKIKIWVNRKMAMLSLAMSNVEKNMLGQSGEPLNSDVNHVQRHSQGQLADSLVNGQITQEVIDLRWRTYKILRESEGVTAEIVGYDDDGMPIVKTRKKSSKAGLKKIKNDNFDNYPLELFVSNDEIAIGPNQAMENENLSVMDEVLKNYDEKGEIASVTHATINSTEYYATNKSEKPIVIIREIIPNFNLENFTLKLKVRGISEEEKLLEFYVSKYPDEYNRTSRLFLSEVKKIMNENIKSNMLEFKGVNFITYKTLGSEDFMEYEYNNISFDKIVEFDGFYVLKFKATVVKNGVDIFEKHISETLENKYKNKQKK